MTYKKIINKICLCVLISLVAACHNVPAWRTSMFERPYGNREYPKIYITGWQHGCESGAEASATLLYRLNYEFKQDWRLLRNPQYVQGWEDAYNHCRKYILSHNKRTS